MINKKLLKDTLELIKANDNIWTRSLNHSPVGVSGLFAGLVDLQVKQSPLDVIVYKENTYRLAVKHLGINYGVADLLFAKDNTLEQLIDYIAVLTKDTIKITDLDKFTADQKIMIGRGRYDLDKDVLTDLRNDKNPEVMVAVCDRGTATPFN